MLRPTLRLLHAALVITAVAAATPTAAPAVPVQVGYRDHGYGNGLAQDPTAEKPESKIWHHDGFWWGCLWDPGSGAYRIHRLDLGTQTWTNTGPSADDRSSTLIDAKSDGALLYIVAHPYDGSSGSSRLYSYDYNVGAQTYSLRSGFPVVVNNDDAEALTVDKDTTGKLWIAWESGGTIWINRSLSGDHDWGTPFALPVQGGSTSSDDVCAIASFGNAIGVLWSNQSDKKNYFAYHVDGNPDQDWEPREVALEYAGGNISDDHVNIALTCDPDCNVYVVSKTSLSGPTEPQIVLARRDAAGNWANWTVVNDNHDWTRPCCVVDFENRDIYVFGKSDDVESGAINVKVADLDAIDFGTDPGQLFIHDGGGINNPASTKQYVDSSTGLLVIASGGSNDYYHNYVGLSATTPVPDIAAVPASFDFGSVEPPASSSTAITVRNTGTADLDVTSTALTGADSAEFSIDGGGGAFTLAPGESTQVDISFAPASVGFKSTTLRFASNDPDEDPFDVPLTGAGVESPFGDSVRIAAFGDFGDNSPAELAVSVLVDSLAVDAIVTTGDNSYGPGPLDVNIGQYYSDYIGDYVGAYGPGSPVNRFFPALGNHDYNDGGGLPAYLDYFTLPGAGIPTTGTSGNERYYDVIAGPVHFFMVNSEGQEPDGTDSSSVQAQWLRTGLEQSSAPWKIVAMHRPPFSSGSNGSDSTMQWPFKEWGATAVLAGHDHDYERVILDDFPYLVTGLGGRNPRDFDSIPVPGSEVRYSLDNGTLLILADENLLTFEFWSVAGGGTLIDSYSPVPLPDIALEPAAHDFGAVLIGDAPTTTVDIRNVGRVTLNIASIDLAGGPSDFAIESGGGVTSLAPGDSTQVVVSFAPLAEGQQNDVLRIVSDDPDENPADVPLSGQGFLTIEPDIAVAPVSHDFGSVILDDSTTVAFSVRNDGLADLSVASVALSGPESAEFFLEGAGPPFVLAPGDSMEVIVGFAPTAAGPKNALLTFLSDDPDEPAVDAALQGAGVLAPAGGPVAFEESVRGGSESSPTVSASGLAVSSDGLYLAAITSKGYETVTGVTGMGATWTRVRAQCGARGQTGAEVWVAQGATAAGDVTATFADVPNSSVILVARYSGVDPASPIGSVESENTIGVQGPCDGGIDNAAYSMSLATTVGEAVVFGAVAMRHKEHFAGSGWTVRDTWSAGSGGSQCGVEIVEQTFTSPTGLVLDGTFDSTVDWAVIGVELKGGGGDQPEITVVPDSFDFGDVVMGDSASTMIRIRNDGTADLFVTSTSVQGPHASEFAITGGTGAFTLTPGDFQDLDVSFSPSTTGTKSAELLITSSDPDEAVVVVDLAGTATGLPTPDIAATPDSHDYGDVDVGSSVAQTFQIQNAGTADLHVGGSTLVGADSTQFGIDLGGGAFTLAPGDSHRVDVSFHPTAPGSALAALRVASDDPDENPFDVPLVGHGTVPAPDIAVAPDSFDFGEVVVSDSASAQFEITNEGTADLQIVGSQLLGTDVAEFNLDSGTGAFVLAPGDTHRVGVSFHPASTGTKSATLRIDSDDSDETPFDVPLAGAGIPVPVPDVAVTPAAHDYGGIPLGQASSATFVIENAGSANLEVVATTLTGADSTDFGIDTGSGAFTLAPGDSHLVDVRFQPIALGPRTTTLRVTSDDPDEPVVDVPLDGTGLPEPVPDIAVVPASHDWGSVPVGQAPANTFVVHNDGDADLVVSAVSVVGPNASEFAAAGAGFTIGAGGTHDVVVTFSPVTTGAKSAMLQLTSNDPDEPVFDASLFGTGVVPPDPTDVSFEESVTGGSTNSSVVTSAPFSTAGSDELFLAAVTSKKPQSVQSVSGLGLTWVLVNEQCGARGQTGMTVYRAFGTSTGGAVTATLSGTPSAAAIAVSRYSGADGGNPIGSVVSGNTLGVDGPCAGGVDQSSYALDLPTTAAGSLVYGAVALRRRTHEPGPGFTERAEFVAGSGGSAAGLAVQDQGPLSPGTVTVSGAFDGTVDWALVAVEILPAAAVDAPDIVVAPMAHDFGTVVAGADSVSRTFIVGNVGTLPLTVTSASLTGSDPGEFTIPPPGTPFILTPGETRDVVAAFAPTSLGAKSALLRIVSDDPDESPLDIGLDGTGVSPPAPDLVVTPAAHDFQSVVVADSAQQTFFAKNAGTADLTVTSIGIAGADSAEFTVDTGTGGFTLAPGDSQAVVASFRPTSLGPKSATIRIESDDPSEPELDVPVTGTGVATPVPDIAIVPTSHDYGDVAVGSSSAHPFEIRNEGSGDLTVTGAELVGGDSGEFSLSVGVPFVVAPAATVEVLVSFAPASLGTKGTTFRVTSDDPDESVVDVALAGTGIDVPPGGAEIVLEETVGGGSSSSAVVTTGGPVTAAPGGIYLAAIGSKKFKEVTSVSGLGLSWTLVASQCGSRGQTGVDVWVGQGVPSGDGTVSATLTGAASNAVIIVSRYSGVDSVDPFGNSVFGNTNGIDGGCGGGTDGAAYSLPLDTTVADAVVFAATAMRHKAHEPGTGWQERLEFLQGRGGSAASVATLDRAVATPTALLVEGSYSGTVDWAVVAIELRPAPLVLAAAGPPGAVSSRVPGDSLARTAMGPHRVELFPTRPNPFRSTTLVEYALPTRGVVAIVIYDTTGRRVRRLVDGEQPAGIRTVVWDGRNDNGARVSAGVYFLRLEAVQTTRLRKVVLTR